MSSSMYPRALLLIAFAGTGAFAMGCGRSPAMPRAAVQMVRLENGGPPVVLVDTDEDDDDDLTPPAGLKKPRPVQYVHMSEWQPPASAKRVEAEVVARGDGPPSYTTFPQLTLHRPIAETTVWGGWGGLRYRR